MSEEEAKTKPRGVYGGQAHGNGTEYLKCGVVLASNRQHSLTYHCPVAV